MILEPIVCGMIVLEGNGARPSHHGDGYIESDKRTSSRCHESKQRSLQDSELYGRSDESPHPKVVGTLMASGYQKQGVQEAMNDMYVVEKIDED